MAAPRSTGRAARARNLPTTQSHGTGSTWRSKPGGVTAGSRWQALARAIRPTRDRPIRYYGTRVPYSTVLR
eukprot:129013-Hanusia_phi.AAC.1